MRKLFSVHKRFLAAGLAGALIIALAAVGLWALGQTASANPDVVALVHVNPDGTDFVGSPYCPQTVWSSDGKARIVQMDARHDCNNITSQNHVIRTEGYDLVANNDGDFTVAPAPANAPVPETFLTQCDGIDNDSDTVVDDGACPRVDEDPVDGVNNDGDNQCDGNLDNDSDGYVNDGCPAKGAAETLCADAIDNDNDGYVNDGCAAAGPGSPSPTAESGAQTDEDPVDFQSWEIANVGANVPTVPAAGSFGLCGSLPIVTSRPNWQIRNNGEQCLIIHSSAPGETSVRMWYSSLPTYFVMKEWDKIIDTVILKAGDVEDVTVPGMTKAQKLPKDADIDGNRDAADEHLMNHDGETQEHAVFFDESLKLTRSDVGPIQLIESVHGQHVDFPDHPTEGAIVLALIDSPRGCTYFTNETGDINGDGLRNSRDSYGTAMVGITDWRGWFIGPKIWPASAQFTDEALAEAKNHLLEKGMSNNADRLTNSPTVATTVVGSQLGVYVDSSCEEQAKITFKVGYPDFVQSVPEIPAPEWVRINWTTIEMAKQPQIRWAGEEIVLEKRWAPGGNWYPEGGAGIDNDQDGQINEDPADDDGDGLINEDPAEAVKLDCGNNIDDDNDGYVNDGCPKVGVLAETAAQCNNNLDDDSDGAVNDGCPVVDKDERDDDQDGKVDEDTGGEADNNDNDTQCDGNLDNDNDGKVNDGCPQVGVTAESGPQIDEDGPDSCPWAGHLVKYSKLGGPGGLISGLPDWSFYMSEPDVVWTWVDANCVSRALYSSEDPGEVDVEATLFDQANGQTIFTAPINKHAFLVWYIKLFQVKLDNVPLKDGNGRDMHNAGLWSGEDPITADGVTEETLNVSQDALARVKVKGWFYNGDPSGRGAVCIDMDGDGDDIDDDGDTLLNEDPKDKVDNDGDTKIDEDTQVPGQPYPVPSYEAGCPDSDDELLHDGYWVLPDDMAKLAGASPDRLATWDVMSEPDVDASSLIGPKSTLDSHDDVLQRAVQCVVIKTVKVSGVDVKEADFLCLRKTVDPDGKITEADALMPPLKVLAQITGSADDEENDKDDDGDTLVDEDSVGFLKMADKSVDLDIKSAYLLEEIAASPDIPTPVNNGGYDWDSWGYNGPVQGPYKFFDILTKHEQFASADNTGHPYIRDFWFYTDNRGLGYFFVNGDFKLTYDDCLNQQLSGTPDCKPGDVVGRTVIDVIGDYPYFRKHPAIESNPVTKTWTWGGFKTVTAERLDNTHTAIIAHLKDRDGYCKFSVGATPTTANSVVFSPSLNEVQHEWIEFLINTEVGYIREISPNALYEGTSVAGLSVKDKHETSKLALDMGLDDLVKIKDHLDSPLASMRSTAATADDLEAGRTFRAERAAVARAEDVRVLDYYGKAQKVDDTEECQAWIIIEHPADQTPNVSVVFHDPEGNIDRHWPESTYLSVLVPGWNDTCYTGPEVDIEEALTKAGLIEVADDGTITPHVLAVYRFTNDETQGFDRWFPNEPDLSTIETISPYDQLFLLLDPTHEPMNWVMGTIMAGSDAGDKDTQLSLIQNWNSVCYAGASMSPDQATASINGSLRIIYSLASDQTWRRYVPNRPDVTNITTLNQYTSVFAFMANAGTWVFSP